MIPLLPVAPVGILGSVTYPGFGVGHYLPVPPLRVPGGKAEFDLPFELASDPGRMWDLWFGGVADGPLTITFSYDASALLPGVGEGEVAIYQVVGGEWVMVDGVVDTASNTVSVSTSSLTLFALGLNPLTGVQEGEGTVSTSLWPPTPNPGSPGGTISFCLGKEGTASLMIYDMTGRLIATLARGEHRAGTFAYPWSGTDDQGQKVPSGVYFARLHAGEYVAVRKMVLLR
jgi:hypothetical protein